jgi:S1-C subfamily serine protease
MNPFNPASTIVPILALDDDQSINHFLGTGAFIGNPPMLLTADHVVRDWKGNFAIAVLPDLSQIYVARVVKRNRKTDLALLEVESYIPPRVLTLAKINSHKQNQMMATFEYSRTTLVGRNLIISPATRVGNITRILNMTNQFGDAGQDALEMSFPALKGASGAPVVSNDEDFNLYGVIIANASYHLLPCQIDTVLDEKNEIFEETKFMLPQAIAVNVKHVHSLLDSI